jgi:hypothetical protein
VQPPILHGAQFDSPSISWTWIWTMLAGPLSFVWSVRACLWSVLSLSTPVWGGRPLLVLVACSGVVSCLISRSWACECSLLRLLKEACTNFCGTGFPVKFFLISSPIFGDKVINDDYIQMWRVTNHRRPEGSAFWWWILHGCKWMTRKDILIHSGWIHTISSFLSKSVPWKLGCIGLHVCVHQRRADCNAFSDCS